MKLYSVYVMDDCENSETLVVAESKEKAEEIVENMDWSCLMWASATEVDIIDGYKIVLEKIEL